MCEARQDTKERVCFSGEKNIYIGEHSGFKNVTRAVCERVLVHETKQYLPKSTNNM